MCPLVEYILIPTMTMGIANAPEICPMMSSKVNEDKGKDQFICSWESEEWDSYQFFVQAQSEASKDKKESEVTKKTSLYFPPANAAWKRRILLDFPDRVE